MDVQVRAEATLKRVLTLAGFDLTGDARPLSAEEAQQFEEPVADFIMKVGMGLDYLLWHANAQHEESDVWAIPEEMRIKYARFYLKRAKAVGWMAQSVRQVQIVQSLGSDGEVAWDVAKRLIASPIFIQSNGGFHPWLKS